MNKFLQALVQHEMRPFTVFLVHKTSTRSEIQNGPYKHLLFESKLPLFPNIVVKRKDLDPSAKGKKFKLMLC